MRISHSGREKYISCGEKYRLHYQERLRSPKLASALFFGSALDEAFSRLLLEKKLTLSESEKLQLLESSDDVFYKNMLQTEHNGEVVDISKNPYADYYASDFEPSLLTPANISLISEFAPDIPNLDETLSFMENCKAVLKGKKKLSAEDLPLYNYITWLTMVEKGRLMLAAYREQIMPQIFEVYSIQEKVELPNEAGDLITGLIDFTCSFVSAPGELVVVDNKTSSKPYKQSQLDTSAQLATYCEYKQTNKAAYVVAEKKPYAKGVKWRCTIITGTIPEETFSATFDGFEKALYNISTSAFEKNFSSCFAFGRMCEFFGLCKHQNAQGLVKLGDVENV